MKFAIGDDVGQLKVITAPRGTDTSLKASARARISSYLEPDRKNPIHTICTIERFRGEERAGLVAVVFASAAVKIVDTGVPPTRGEREYVLYEYLPGAVTGVVSAGYQDGMLYVFWGDGGVCFFRFGGDVRVRSGRVGNGRIAAGAMFTDTLIDDWPCAVAVGGEKRDVEVFEAADDGWKSVWKAKNLKRDKLGLEVPVWIKSIAFLPSDTSTATKRCYRIYASTHYSHIRLYDTQVSRRPVFSAKLTNSPIHTLQLHPATPASASRPLTLAGESPESARTIQDLQFIYSDANGHFGTYSSSTRRDVGLYKGATGAVLSTTTLGKDVVAGVGFDRYLRVYGRGRSLLVKAYVKSRGTAVAVLDGEDEEVVAEKSVEEVEEENVWGEMEEVDGSGGEAEGGEGDITEMLVKVRKRRPRTDKEGGGSKKRRVEV